MATPARPNDRAAGEPDRRAAPAGTVVRADSGKSDKHDGQQPNRDLWSCTNSPGRTYHRAARRSKKSPSPLCTHIGKQPHPFVLPPKRSRRAKPRSAPLRSRGPRGVKPDVTVPSGETAVQARQNPTASGHTQSERPTASDARANSNAGLDPHVARRLLFAKLASGGEGRPARASALVSAQRRDMARAAGNTRGGRGAGRGRGRWRCGFSRRPTSPCCVGASRDRAGQRCPSHGRTVAEQLF